MADSMDTLQFKLVSALGSWGHGWVWGTATAPALPSTL